MNSDQTNAENARINKENAAKDDACPDLKGIKLTRVNLVHNHAKDSSHHKSIKKEKLYLALIYNNWYLGKFHKIWYGWSFDNWGNGARCELDHIQILYETDLIVPKLNHTPQIKFVATNCEWCEADLPEDEDEDEHYKDENGLTICYNCWEETFNK